MDLCRQLKLDDEAILIFGAFVDDTALTVVITAAAGFSGIRTRSRQSDICVTHSD